MKSDLQITRIKQHTPEWYAFRRNGIGGSEIGTVLGLNKYDTVIRLFHEKVGTIQPRMDDNNLMFWGRTMEDKIADIWQFYDNTDYGYIDNYKNGRVIRTCRNVNGYIVNPKYPWLFASLDRLINIKGGFNFLTGEALSTEAVLECKTLTYWASQIWQDGIPIYYLAQVTQYMIILETDYAEIAILQDGNKFHVEKIQRDEALCQRIIQISKRFWDNRVLPAREAFEKQQIARMEGKIGLAEQYEGAIQRYEPEPDSSQAYEQFMNERFLKERHELEGTLEMYALCKIDAFYRKFIKRLVEERQFIANSFINILQKHGTDVIDFGRGGNITWSERRRSKNRTFKISIREAPKEEQIEEQFEKLDPECY
jgi:putative phage-type endonuclease